MDEDIEQLLRRLTAGDPDAPREILARATGAATPTTLVVAAVLTGDAETLGRADNAASTTRERHLAAVAAARLTGDLDRLDVLVRDHLADHPDDHVASWIAHAHHRQNRTGL